MRQALIHGLVCGAISCQGVLAAERPAPPPDPNPISVDFETEQIQGTIRSDGAYHGVTRLVDKRTGRQVIDPRYSALNLFKLMSANQMMGQPRLMQRISRRTGETHVPPDSDQTPEKRASDQASRKPAGDPSPSSRAGQQPAAVESLGAEIRWPPGEGHQGELVARYEVRPPNAVDLILTLRSRGTYPGYEVFLSSYFDKALRPEVCLKTRGNESPERVLPTVNDVFRGTVLVFPRDALAARLCLDGRWERSEYRAPVVQMCPVRRYAECIAVQGDAQSRLGVVLMSDPRCCYAISTRYHADTDADRLTTYSAFDLSLFGDNVVPGTELRAVVRLAVVELDDEWKNVRQAYQTFLATQGERR